jgi:hypothetical protein
MKIAEIKIHNFRSMAEKTIRFGNYSLLIYKQGKIAPEKINLFIEKIKNLL